MGIVVSSITLLARRLLTSTAIIMKLIIVIAALCVGAYAGFDLANLVLMEVKAISQADRGMTVVDCATKCDAEFSLIAGRDEQQVDSVCLNACNCVLKQKCDGIQGGATKPAGGWTKPTGGSWTKPADGAWTKPADGAWTKPDMTKPPMPTKPMP